MRNLNKIINLILVLTLFLWGVEVSAQKITQMERWNQRYQKIHHEYLKQVDFLKMAKEEFLRAKEKYQESKTAQERRTFEEAKRNYLEKIINSLIKRLEVIKAWITDRQNLLEAEKTAILTEIEKDINWLKELLSKVETASSDQLKEMVKTLRSYWKTHRIRVKRIIGEIWVARLNFLIKKQESFGEELKAKIEDLETKGKDITQLKSWLEEFNQKLNLAKEKIAAAKAKFDAIKAEPGLDPGTQFEEAMRLFKEGHELIIEANQILKEAHGILVKIAKETKKMGGRIATPTAETSTSP